MLDKRLINEGLTFDDVLIVPGFSEVLPKDVDITTKLTPKIKLNIPLLSSAMDTVTESPLAIAIARDGGIGIIHKNIPPNKQAEEVAKVKKAAFDKKIAALDANGKLLVGAAVSVTDSEFDRAGLLMEAGADVIVVDTAHGHSRGVIEMVKRLRRSSRKLQIIAGNIATATAAEALIAAGADALKVGVGPGSICTTRIVTGSGMPQMSAIASVASVARKKGVCVIADGGVKYSGDIVKAIAAGAHSVMIGSLFAGTDEAPGELIIFQSRKYKVYRGMGSLGAMQKGSRDRYFQNDIEEVGKLVPEGIEGQVPYCGALHDVIHQMIGGLRSGMGYAGVKNIEELCTKSKFVKITKAGLRESHVHDVDITREAPNYSVE